ncbi:MAG: HAMP domain-containing histidine kinase [Clostridiales bacterium]|nr:HAMP domain-containing histidine kinase [Clostridiales bacterium]
MMNIFHDLRNPVFVMKGCLHNISAENSTQKRYKELAETRLAQLEKMVEDLFLAEKLETGQLLLCEEHVFLPNLMRTVADSARISASVNISVSLFIETECFVWGDSLRLLQAFQNLTENALSHLPQNGQLTISLRQEENHAVCLFTDNGSGIPTEDLPHIFERYYTSASSRKNTATGLGLSIANELIRLHGGTISVQSKPQYGTTFTVIIPCTTPPHDLEEAFRWE